MLTALYPGSFDPVTNGHVDLVRRASRVFDRVLVTVYDAPPKALLFNTGERVALFREAIPDLPNVEVMPFTGLTVEVARRMGAQVIIRGLRAGSDFEYEFEMALMNKKLAPDVEALYMMSSLEWQFLSSSRVKEVAQLGGDITSLVPPHVSSALRARLQVSTG
ncbi:MAG: pantetheine-phosphate adenylyltransferase [Chloroflexi bacterium]|nr:pantetheine-phosphate adenylyltransferase [Chloroflexota bacterium]